MCEWWPLLSTCSSLIDCFSFALQCCCHSTCNLWILLNLSRCMPLALLGNFSLAASKRRPLSPFLPIFCIHTRFRLNILFRAVLDSGAARIERKAYVGKGFLKPLLHSGNSAGRCQPMPAGSTAVHTWTNILDLYSFFNCHMFNGFSWTTSSF